MDLSQVTPELRSALRRIPAVPYQSRWMRRLMQAILRMAPCADVDGVEITTVEAADAQLRLYRPSVRKSDAALLWIHGGGFLIGRAVQDDRFCAETAAALGMVVASADYRLAPEHPFPAPLDDCHAVWTWLQGSATKLGIDPSRVVVGGQSAGGGLAASLVQRLHDAATARAFGQWLFCPMLDDRTAALQDLDALRHRVWDNRKNRFGWRAFLAAEPGGRTAPPYAAAARREDLHGLPPTWMGVGKIDLFYDEDVAYADRLKAAGVPVALTTVPGAPHGFEAWAADTELARTFVRQARDWLSSLLQER